MIIVSTFGTRVTFGYRSRRGHEVWAEDKQTLARQMLRGTHWCGEVTAFDLRRWNQDDVALLVKAAETPELADPLLPTNIRTSDDVYSFAIREDVIK